MSKGLILSAFCAVLLGFAARAAEPAWQAAGDGGYAIDRGSLTREGDIVAATFKLDLKKPRKAPAGPPYVRLVGAVKADCAGQRLQRLTTGYYGTGGALIQETKSGRWSEIGQASVLRPVFEALCGRAVVPKDTAAATPVSVGTAWATNKGYLVTAAHVIEGGKTIEVMQDGRKLGEARLVAADVDDDVAVLRFAPTDGGRLRIILLADKPAVLGKAVFTLGYPEPAVLGQRVKMAAGNVSGEAGLKDDERFLQISAPIQQGNSGGPLLGFDGKAVGVISAKLERFDNDKASLRPENINYAVKVDYVRPLLDGLPDLGGYAPVRAGGSAEALVAQAKDAVFMLVVTP